MKIKVASRESLLAVVQANMVIDSMRAACPGAEIELLTMKTTGDRILDRTLDKVGGKGLFVKELELALREGRADVTVHSMKDMTMEVPDDLPVVAVSQREDPRDALVLPEGAGALEPGKPIGCSSFRRAAQLAALFPGVEIKPVRGNVQTRLRKLDGGEYGALVLACAGLRRLGLESRISRIFSTDEILPAACQGILAVQARADFDPAPLAAFHDPETAVIAAVERAFVRALDGGCSSPVACYCTRDKDALTITGFVVDEAGTPRRRTVTTSVTDGVHTAERLANEMKNGECT